VNRIIERNKEKRSIIEAMIVSFFKEFPEESKAIIEIKQDKDSRSTKQNRLYWEWVSVFSAETGYHKDEMHMILVDKFLGSIQITTKKGKSISTLRSTKDLKLNEFKEYLEQIDIFAAGYSIVLPRTEDLYLASMGIKRK
jgi:hypothetical protein